MSKIVLIDPFYTGHHISYANNLAKKLKENGYTVIAIGNPKWFESFKQFVDKTVSITVPTTGKNQSYSQIDKIKFIKNCLKTATSFEADIIHFLYLDRFIFAAAAAIFCTSKFHANIRATLHWGYLLPEFSFSPFQKFKSWLERYALRTLTSSKWRIMVHSPALKSRIGAEISSQYVDYVPYPIEPLPHVARADARKFIVEKFNLDKNSYVVLLFGDTRSDKGADFAVQALSFLPDHYHFLVVGKSNANAEKNLRKIADDSGVRDRLHLHLHFVPDCEVPFYFNGADIALIPYRKIFSGQSGPLTLAASAGTPIVAANLLVLSETIRDFNLGRVFEPEDVRSLVDTLQSMASFAMHKDSKSFVSAHSDHEFFSQVESSYFHASKITNCLA